MEGTPKDYLLAKDRRLKEGLRASLGLHPYLEGHSHGGIVHVSKLEAITKSIRNI